MVDHNQGGSSAVFDFKRTEKGNDNKIRIDNRKAFDDNSFFDDKNKELFLARAIFNARDECCIALHSIFVDTEHVLALSGHHQPMFWEMPLPKKHKRDEKIDKP